MDVSSLIAIVISVVSLVFSLFTWRAQGYRLRVRASFTHVFLRDQGGNNFGLQVVVSNFGRGKVQIIDWSLKSRTVRIGKHRIGVRSSINGKPVEGSSPIPMVLDGPAQAKWSISLVDPPDRYPRLDDLIGEQARVEVEVAGRKRPIHTPWFDFPARSARRSSAEIAAENGMSIAEPKGARSGSALSIAELLVDPIELGGRPTNHGLVSSWLKSIWAARKVRR